MHDERADIRGTRSYAADALKNQPAYWVQQVNLARRKKGLPAVGVSGRPWEQCTVEERANIKAAQTADRLEDARQEARLFELQQELKRLKAEVASRES